MHEAVLHTHEEDMYLTESLHGTNLPTVPSLYQPTLPLSRL
jgi:hypothetical protein